jgi:hypothetical protein
MRVGRLDNSEVEGVSVVPLLRDPNREWTNLAGEAQYVGVIQQLREHFPESNAAQFKKSLEDK